jgi:hypothetical protein
MSEVTRINVRLGTTVNLGDFENIRLDIEVQDYVREGIDKNAGEAINRVHELVEKKLAEKLNPFRTA